MKEVLLTHTSIQADQSLNSFSWIILFTIDMSVGSDRDRMECGTRRVVEILTHWSLHTPGPGGGVTMITKCSPVFGLPMIHYRYLLHTLMFDQPLHMSAICLYGSLPCFPCISGEMKSAPKCKCCKVSETLRALTNMMQGSQVTGTREVTCGLGVWVNFCYSCHITIIYVQSPASWA